ncbi:hypothetical protein [Saccharothrix lopnurensis]|uniref:Signal transduction histidine kinase n=1 Tax=Saccharothrix lopnurensis TaxID=1670621 RepID=A0ABW1P580_9PSEU
MTANSRLVLLAVAAVIQPGLGLAPMLDHDHHPAAWLAYALFALVTLGCAGWVARRRPLPAPVVAGGVVAVFAASAIATWALPPDDHFGPAHWSIGLVGWQLLVLLGDRLGVLLAALSAHVALSVVQWVLAGTPDRVEVGGAGVVLLGVTSFQVGTLVILRMLLRAERQADLMAAEQERATTRAVVAEQWEQDLRARFAGRLGTTLPLLADLADGVLDPRDEGTRLRCALAATQLRRLFAEHDDVPDPLVHEVAACAHVAEQRGVAVSLAVSGASVPVPAEVRRALTAPVELALAAARARARVSLLRTGTEVRVAVVSDAAVPDTQVSDTPIPDTPIPDTPGPDTPVPGPGGTAPSPVEVETGTYGEHTRMEVRWRAS